MYFFRNDIFLILFFQSYVFIPIILPLFYSCHLNSLFYGPRVLPLGCLLPLTPTSSGGYLHIRKLLRAFDSCIFFHIFLSNCPFRLFIPEHRFRNMCDFIKRRQIAITWHIGIESLTIADQNTLVETYDILSFIISSLLLSVVIVVLHSSYYIVYFLSVASDLSSPHE